MTGQAQPPAVLYAAKSTEDKRGSIPTQLADARAMAEREGWEVVGEFSDEGFSAFKGNRGPDLERAKAAAAEAAAERGEAMLVVQHSDRLARGAGDAPGAADHLGEVYFWARRLGIRLRSVQDDANLEDVIRAVLIGERNTEDSRRKAEAVAAGLRRAAERGDWAGGILADGYRAIYSVDGRGERAVTVEYDPERKAIYDLIWDLAGRGFSAAAIVAELDRRGFRTSPRKRGHEAGPFDANRIRQTLDNPFYAGLALYRGEVVGEGRWPRYVSPEDFHRLREERRVRSRAGRARGPGRPPEGYLLARLAACGACGSPMDAVTNGYVRKDGSRSRRYTCRAHRERPQDCSAQPIDAAVVDASLVDNLAAVLGDVEAIRSGVAAARGAEKARLEAEARDAQEDAKKQAVAMEKMAARMAALYAAGEDEKAAALEEALTRVQARQAAAETRMTAAIDALAGALRDEEGAADDDAAFWTRLRAEVATRVDGARGDVKRLNLALSDFLESVALTGTANGVEVVPKLSEEAAGRILRDAGRYPHVEASFGGIRARPLPSPRHGQRIEELAYEAEMPEGMDPDEFRRRLVEGDEEYRVDHPPPWEAGPGENPHTPW